MKKVVIWVLAGMAVLGMGYAVFKDYRPWVHAERANFGHGPGELGTVGAANKMFQEDGAAVRINYPEKWMVQDVWGRKSWPVKTDAAIFTTTTGSVKVTLGVFDMHGSLVDIADNLVKEREGWGWTAWGARQYITTDRTSVTVLTWQIKQPDGEMRMEQEGIAKKGNKLVVVTADCSLADWRTYSGTFWEMYKSVVII